MEAPGGRKGDEPVRTARAISARACRARRSSAARASSPAWEEPARDRREGAPKDPDDRYPLDRPRHPPGRQLDGLPGGGARV